MGSIAFFRHAQASFFGDDYDQLSEHGQRQSQLLGEHWKTQGACFTQVIVGPCLRHRQTAEIALAACGREAKIVELPEFDEHQVDQLVIEHRESLAEEHPELVPLVNALASASGKSAWARQFQFLFEAITGLWLTGNVTRPDVQSWLSFQDRVNRGITKVLAIAAAETRQSQRIAVFSSVGPISVAFQRATGCSDESAIATGWRLRNSSLTRTMFSGKRFTLDCFNSISHLADPNDWTYR